MLHTNQSVDQSINQSIHQPITHQSNQSIDSSSNQPIDHSINQSTKPNQSIESPKHPTNPRIIQYRSIDQEARKLPCRITRFCSAVLSDGFAVSPSRPHRALSSRNVSRFDRKISLCIPGHHQTACFNRDMSGSKTRAETTTVCSESLLKSGTPLYWQSSYLL